MDERVLGFVFIAAGGAWLSMFMVLLDIRYWLREIVEGDDG